jgi:hypothetical protein
MLDFCCCCSGLANFVDNNCWFLFGTRLKSNLAVIKPFTDASKKGKWVILTSDDELDDDKVSMLNTFFRASLTVGTNKLDCLSQANFYRIV